MADIFFRCTDYTRAAFGLERGLAWLVFLEIYSFDKWQSFKIKVLTRNFNLLGRCYRDCIGEI